LNRTLIYEKKNLLDIQKELVKTGEFANSQTTITYAENRFAQALIDAKVRVQTGYKVEGYEFDIKIHQYPILIEVDGGVHNDNGRRQKDYLKDRLATRLGYKVYRFTNEDIKQVSEVVHFIKTAIQDCTRQPHKTYLYPLSPFEYLKYMLFQRTTHPDLSHYYLVDRDSYRDWQSWKDKGG
jgi:very-short-patch-repair endonuclease